MFIVLEINDNIASYRGQGKSFESAYNTMRNEAYRYIDQSGCYESEMEEICYDEAHNLVTDDVDSLQEMVFEELSSLGELEFDTDNEFEHDNIIRIGGNEGTVFQIVQAA